MPSTDIQTLAAQKLADFQTSTHSVAAQASAARMIRILRSAYPGIKTSLLTDKDNPELAKKIVENWQTGGKPSQDETRILENILDKKLKAQATLIDYLEKIIKSIENKKTEKFSASELHALQHPDIQHTVKLIDHILKPEEEKKSDESNEPTLDKLSVFKQMLSLAKTCPGLWDDKEKRNMGHCTNNIYNPETKTLESVIFCPAESLNLISQAILDNSRFLIQKDDIDKNKGDLEKTQQEYLAHRIFSFSAACFRLQKEAEAQNAEVCPTGRNNALLYLLNKSYLENGNPVQLIEDIDPFLLERLTHFVEQEVKKLTRKEEQSQLYIDWISYQSGLMHEEKTAHPVVTLLLKNNSEWAKECIKFLEEQCAEYGLDPAQCKLAEYPDYIKNLSCPVTADSTLPVFQKIMDKLKLLPKSSDDISELIIARNKASILFQDKIKKNNDLLSHKRNMERFFVALELFENLQQYSDSIASFQDRYFINPIIS